jgi:tRNA threonylcarbamoyladenosine biosynthesis protein TsaB
LAIDTATEACSVALLAHDREFVFFTETPRQHTRVVFPAIDQLLAESGISLKELDFLALTRGPGSFTGVRIAASLVQGMAFALNKPVVMVSTLQVLAQRCYREMGHEHILAAIDARMQEVYWGEYRLGDQGVVDLIGDERVLSMAAIDPISAAESAVLVGAGTGWAGQQQTEERLGVQHCYPHLLPHAKDLIDCALREVRDGRYFSAEAVLPVYLRDQVVHRHSVDN